MDSAPTGRTALGALHVRELVTVVVSVDILFFRHRFLERLAANIGTVPGVRGVRFPVPAPSRRSRVGFDGDSVAGAVGAGVVVNRIDARRVFLV